uniref:Uncharacterized protein n=1 Tax=Rousettus aegyptiacus TaxID=9407 RepID=A0A7J8HSS9_ROUAE|nr:hypothetical protein HJG63_011057 [Rousettus aegyptiacus]
MCSFGVDSSFFVLVSPPDIAKREHKCQPLTLQKANTRAKGKTEMSGSDLPSVWVFPICPQDDHQRAPRQRPTSEMKKAYTILKITIHENWGVKIATDYKAKVKGEMSFQILRENFHFSSTQSQGIVFILLPEPE